MATAKTSLGQNHEPFYQDTLHYGARILQNYCPKRNPLKYLNTSCRYSANSFKLHRLPVPRPGVVLGLVGTNGIGKSTALKILSGKQKPNLGRVRYCKRLARGRPCMTSTKVSTRSVPSK